MPQGFYGFSIHNVVVGGNLLTGSNASCSSGSTGATIDGSTSTYYQSHNVSEAFVWDLKVTYLCNTFRVYTTNQGGDWLDAFTLYGSLDGVTYTTIKACSTPALNMWNTYQFSSTYVRYLKLVNGAVHWPVINEAELYHW